jgi:serine/threonine-protein kinase
MSVSPVQIPPAVGRYRLSRHLGSDAFSDVYEGFDPLLERPVIVRAFRRPALDPARDSAVQETFYREMQRVGTLMHHGIATLFDAGDAPGLLFMASEFVQATSLSDVLATGGSDDIAPRVSMLAQIVDALESAREQGVAHLNLRPSLVLVAHDGQIKLSGFGVAPVIDALTSAAELPAPAATRYTAPERAAGARGDHRADVFSLAVIALDLLTGSPGDRSVLSRVDPSRLPAPLAAAGVSQNRWEAVFDRALAGDPADRFESPAAFEVELLLTLGVTGSDFAVDDRPFTSTRTPVASWTGGDVATVLASEIATQRVTAPLVVDETCATSHLAGARSAETTRVPPASKPPSGRTS